MKRGNAGSNPCLDRNETGIPSPLSAGMVVSPRRPQHVCCLVHRHAAHSPLLIPPKNKCRNGCHNSTRINHESQHRYSSISSDWMQPLRNEMSAIELADHPQPRFVNFYNPAAVSFAI
jgi:hypothetical protein